ncbi:hypothetical protein AALP_AAs50226U000100 [Arabis alpina]|uniref:Uncharacterized protein n=1 Tax=Arabis alpina TaxID=50452 RepID=A0A087FWS2_ARAAL|nr:hypothetical protein AALP_AAs50226U000100 [Arabis alpina]
MVASINVEQPYILHPEALLSWISCLSLAAVKIRSSNDINLNLLVVPLYGPGPQRCRQFVGPLRVLSRHIYVAFGPSILSSWPRLHGKNHFDISSAVLLSSESVPDDEIILGNSQRIYSIDGFYAPCFGFAPTVSRFNERFCVLSGRFRSAFWSFKS